MKFNYKYLVATIYAIALFLDRLDLTIVNIILPSIADSYDIPVTSTDLVSLSFLLALAISIPIGCWLGERYGFKKIFILSMFLFGLGSTLCAFASSLPILLLLRFLHGIGGGMLIPVGMTIVYRTFDKSEYAIITSMTFLPSLIAPAIAPFLGGLIQELFGWQMVFMVSGPIALIMSVVSICTLNNDRSNCGNKLDLIGFLLFSAILLDLFYTFSLIGHTKFPLLILVGILSLCIFVYLFIRREKSITNPLIDLGYFSNQIFAKSIIIQLCFQICYYGSIYIFALYLQIGVGMIASMAGLVMGMQAVGAICTSRYSATLFNRSGAKLPITIGLIGLAVLSPLVLLIRREDMFIYALILFFTRGLFIGLCSTPIQTLSVITFSKTDISSVNTLFNSCRQVSISVGIAISSALMLIGFNEDHLPQSTHIIDKSDLFPVFGPGIMALPIAGFIGALITSGIRTHALVKDE